MFSMKTLYNQLFPLNCKSRRNKRIKKNRTFIDFHIRIFVVPKKIQV